LDPLQDCRIVADFRKKVGFCFYGYLGPPPRLPYCDLKKKVGFCFYGWLGPPPRLPYSGFGEKKGKVSTAVRYLRAAPYVFLKKGFYGGTLLYARATPYVFSQKGRVPTAVHPNYAVRVFGQRKFLRLLETTPYSLIYRKEVGRIRLFWTPSRNAVNRNRIRKLISPLKRVIYAVRKQDSERAIHDDDRKRSSREEEKSIHKYGYATPPSR